MYIFQYHEAHSSSLVESSSQETNKYAMKFPTLCILKSFNERAKMCHSRRNDMTQNLRCSSHFSPSNMNSKVISLVYVSDDATIVGLVKSPYEQHHKTSARRLGNIVTDEEFRECQKTPIDELVDFPSRDFLYSLHFPLN